MKSLIQSIKKTLCKKRGETLVEAIISILLLAILMTTVTVMIQTSLRLTANSMTEAEGIQNLTFNPAILDTFPDLPEGIITFEKLNTGLSLIQDIIDIEADHNIRIYEDIGHILSFYPDK